MAHLLRPLRDIAPSVLARALGVTRIARLTGLDRTGVEVATAVRPDGHVLQVTNGKGDAWDEAVRGALLEAAELWAAERPAPGPTASAAELRARLGDEAVLGPGVLADPDVPAAEAESWEALRIAWSPATPLGGGAPVLVPAQAAHCPPPGGAALGPGVLRWTSNGMGAHPDRASALLHALLEAIERDRLARALPEGFTHGEVARRLLDPRTLPGAAPRTAARVAALEARGFRVHLMDVGDVDPRPRLRSASRAPQPGRRERTDERSRGRPGSEAHLGLGLAVAAALLVDEGGGAVPVAAGYACRPGRDEALSAALLEAVQSRATEIHGAREDVLHGDRDSAVPLAARCAAVRPVRSAAAMPDPAAVPAGAAVRGIVARLHAAGIGPALSVDLAGPAEVHVVKVLAPGLLLSELL
jgi:ribosomal protein S12 methylthiotransferase accessory factor